MVPDGWSAKSLAEITKQKISYGIVQAGPHVEDGVPYLKSSNVGGNISVETLQKTCPKIHEKYKRSSVHPGDIVFSLRGNLGECSVVPDDLAEANLTQGTARISVSSPHSVNFVRYQITSRPVLNRIQALSKGSTFKEISLEELRKLTILLPQPFEQERIAEILSTWDRAIETTEKLIANSQAQKKALMQQLLTGKKRLPGFHGEWKKRKFGEIALVRKGKALSGKDLKPGPYPVIAGGKTSPYSHAEFTHSNVITVSASGAYAGHVALHTHRIWASDCSVVQGTDRLAIEYAYQFLFLNQRKIYSLQSGGAQPHIYPADIEGINILVPPIDEQKAIASLLSAADGACKLLHRQVEHLRDQKAALMQQLLTGKRRVKIQKEAAA